MISVEYAQTMASYNREMNLRVYTCCASLSDEVRKRDVGAFFKSIHGTLNHLLLGDRVWMGRFTAQPFSIQSLAQELYADFAELRAQRAQTDEHIVEWAQRLTAPHLASTLSYTPAASKATPRHLPLWFAVTHFFNHQAHHRGQVTTLLSQQGIDVGVTDLIAFPVAM
jgi:uncharacterized damage-inducible protein DinB